MVIMVVVMKFGWDADGVDDEGDHDDDDDDE